MEATKYTEKEIQFNIERLSNRLEGLKRSRTEISQEVNQVKKQIIAWEELDDSQFKMFP
jgi:hypothetical protein